MLDFKNASMVFPDGTVAVDDISLHVRTGEFCVLLGPSGAGKSTLLGMINGIVTPTSGNVMLDRDAITPGTIRDIQKRIGMVHQQLHLVPRLSVLHNVLSGLLPITPLWRALFKIFPTAQQRKACQLLEEVELEEIHLYRRASMMSGGQQQRVAIAPRVHDGPGCRSRRRACRES